MSGLFNLIKNLFSGIFSFFNGFLSGSKQDDAKAIQAGQPQPKKRASSTYFLELDDAKSSATTEAKAKPATTAPAAQPATTPDAAPVQTATAVQSQPKPEPSAAKAAAPAKEPEPVAAKPQTSNPLNLPQPTVTFAPEYLASTSSTNGRRRPGANMNYFLDLARQAKTPARG